MTLRLYMDEHVPVAIALALDLAGVDVLTVQDDGRRGRKDPELLHRARELGRVVFTQDEDFLREAHLWQEKGDPFLGVIYAHQLQMTIGEIVGDLELLAKVAEPHELTQYVQYLPLK
ncbi:MAG: DUF5615 family PIN-like protein [Acidobacteriota bacterium]